MMSQPFVPAHGGGSMMHMAGMPMPAPYLGLTQRPQGFNSNTSQLVPQTSLTEECPTHPGQMILFDTEDESWCEKCYADVGKDVTVAPQPDNSPEDLIARLKAPVAAQPVQPLNQAEQVMDLHKKIEGLCQNLLQKIEKKNEGLILNHEHFGLYE
jgi:hypothetical protein